MPFPSNVQEAISQFAADIDGVEATVLRPLRPVDCNGSVGISALDWKPLDMEIGHFNPVVSRYQFRLESLVKHTDPAEGSAVGSTLATRIRTMLYRNEALRIRLGGMQETIDGVVERVQRWGVSQQRFAANDVKGTFLHLSTIDIWVETETS